MLIRDWKSLPPKEWHHLNYSDHFNHLGAKPCVILQTVFEEALKKNLLSASSESGPDFFLGMSGWGDLT